MSSLSNEVEYQRQLRDNKKKGFCCGLSYRDDSCVNKTIERFSRTCDDFDDGPSGSHKMYVFYNSYACRGCFNKSKYRRG